MEIRQFQVIYSPEKDAKNWFEATRSTAFYGKSWSDGLFGYYLKLFNQISKLSDEKALKEAKDIVVSLYDDRARAKKQQIEKKLKSNFQDACAWIEKTTGKHFSEEKTTIFLTTFPRAPYSPEENLFYFCVHWDDIIGVFLHEAIHMQIYRYWRTNSKSRVSELSEDNFIILSESMTFLVNEAPKNLVIKKDSGYPEHSELRKELSRVRKEKKLNFGELLEFGAKKLLLLQN